MTEDKGFPSYQGFLNKNSVTIAEALGSSGYVTALIGKWHVGEAQENWPMQRGFQNFYGIPQGGGTYFYPFLLKRELWLDNPKITPNTGFYSTDAFNNFAVNFVAKQEGSEKPFFLYLAHIAPHFPLQAREEDIRKYRGKYKVGYEKIRNERLKNQLKKGIFPKSIQPSTIISNSLDWVF